MKSVAWGFIVLLIGVIAGCAQYRLIQPGKYALAGAYSLEPQINWSSKKHGSKIEFWTVDGFSLQKVLFVKGLEDGDALFPDERGRGAAEQRPEFKSYMTANEIMEFVVDSLHYAGRGRVETKNLRPARFGTAPGHRFDYTCVAKNGLEMQGLVAGTLLNARLYLILYEGTRHYYFEKHRADVERLVASVRLL